MKRRQRGFAYDILGHFSGIQSAWASILNGITIENSENIEKHNLPLHHQQIC